MGVDQLVVGDAGAWSIGNGHASLTHHVDEPSDAEHGIPAEHARVEEVIVNAAVDHIHGTASVGVAKPYPAFIAEEIAAFHQRNAHLLG